MTYIKSIKNHMNQPINRIIQVCDYYEENFYVYDDNGRLINRTAKNKNGQIMQQTVKKIIYDSLGHIQMKTERICYYSDTISQKAHEINNIFIYLNTYDENNLLIKKCCTREKIIAYSNNYYYKNGQLIKTEKFNNEGNLKFYECYHYLENQCTVTIYLANGTLSHTCKYELSSGQVIKKEPVSPSNGKYKRAIHSMEDSSLEISMDEDQLIPDMMNEIVDYIIKIDGINFVVICFDYTDVDTYQDELWRITIKVLSEYNIRIVFAM